MSCLSLRRVLWGASTLSRLVPRNTASTVQRCEGFLRKATSGSAFSTCIRSPLVASAGALAPRHSCKVLAELSPSLVLQRRAASTGGDHVRLWQLERIVAASFIILMPACFILENSLVDALFTGLVVMHAHWGLEAVIVDYARPAVVGNLLPKVAFASLYLLSALTFVGLLTLIYSDGGLAKTIKHMWAVGRDPPRKA